MYTIYNQEREASLVAQMVKNLPAMQETQVSPQGKEDPLEKGMATNSSILAWKIPWTEESGRLQFIGSQRIKQNTHTHPSLYQEQKDGSKSLETLIIEEGRTSICMTILS